MNLIIGVLTTLTLVFCFSFFEKNKLSSYRRTKFFFFLYVLFFSQILKPSDNLYLWIGFSFLFYCVLDDLISNTLNIYIPIVIVPFFLITIGNTNMFLISFLFFLVFLLLAKFSDEHIIGEGDAYMMIPILLILSNLDEIISALLLSSLLAINVLIPFYFYKKHKIHFAFSQFLLLGTALVYSFDDLFYLFAFLIITSPILSLIFYLSNFIKKRKNKDK